MLFYKENFCIQYTLCCTLFQMTVAAGTSIENNIQRTISCPNVCFAYLGFLSSFNAKFHLCEFAVVTTTLFSFPTYVTYFTTSKVSL